MAGRGAVWSSASCIADSCRRLRSMRSEGNSTFDSGFPGHVNGAQAGDTPYRVILGNYSVIM